MQPIYLKIELEGMRQQIVHAFTARQLELAEILDAEISKAFKDLDFTAIVRAQVQKVIPELIEKAVESTAREILWSEEYRALLKAIAARAIEIYAKERS